MGSRDTMLMLYHVDAGRACVQHNEAILHTHTHILMPMMSFDTNPFAVGILHTHTCIHTHIYTYIHILMSHLLGTNWLCVRSTPEAELIGVILV